MKRFGVQLAASGLVILLGALGVAQAQRDSHSVQSSEWEVPTTPALTPPPVPIAAFESDLTQKAEAGPSTEVLGSFGLPTGTSFPARSGSVQTVAHEEPIDPAASGPGSFSESKNDPATSAPSGMSLPAWSVPSASAASAGSPPSFQPQPRDDGGTAGSAMLLPEFDPASTNSAASPRSNQLAELPQQPSDDAAASMPTLTFDEAPTNALRGSGSSFAAAAPTEPNSFNPVPTTTSSAQLQTPSYPEESAAYPAMPLKSIGANDAYPQGPAARIASLPRAGLPNLSQPQSINPRDEETVLAEPGDRRLEGVQSPSIVIHKRAPEEVKVGKPATFIINVQNSGGVEALDVRVHDRVPAGMRLVDASPSPSVQGDLLTWELGALEPGGERTVTMQLIPEQEGELGSVARVTFEAAASVRTISTRPELKITQRAREDVLIGQQLEIDLEVSNPGSGAATGVILQVDVPEGLDHPKGRQLDNVIGTLAPGEVRRQVLRLRAVAPGQIENRVRLIGDDGLTAEDVVTVQVTAPQLAIELEGPSRRFLERQAVFNVNLANVGTADATNVEVVAYLDRGFSFVGTEYQGQYDPNRHAVYWSLAELPANGRGSVPLTLLPIEQGERAIRLEAKGDLNLVAQSSKSVNVDTLAELTFSITDDADPIEVGSEATYEIRITNQGSRDDGDVKLQIKLPPGLELVSSEAEASTDGKGLIAFAPTASLPAGRETIHRVRVSGVAAGTHVVKAIVTSAQASVPVTKEESTMVYSDQ